MKSNKIYLFFYLILAVVFSSCNSDWTEEQYEQYISFKAPLEGYPGLTRLRLKYRSDSVVNYKLPLIVSGSTMNQKTIEAYVDLDVDTLNDFNVKNYYNRTDLYYKLLEPEYYKLLSNKVTIPAGECQGFLDIDFDFRNLDLVDKWILPLTVQDDPSYNYTSHPLKNFNNALLWISPFNDFSGSYGTTDISITTQGSNKPIVVNNREAYVVDEKTVFFYAGAIKEIRADRRFFKVYMKFHEIDEETGWVEMWSDNPELKFNVKGNPTYKILNLFDTSQPFLLHKTITVQDLEYSFVDPNETPGFTMEYTCKGTMSMTRKINTLIPDEEFAIQW